jgi:hypothetical protein
VGTRGGEFAFIREAVVRELVGLAELKTITMSSAFADETPALSIVAASCIVSLCLVESPLFAVRFRSEAIRRDQRCRELRPGKEAQTMAAEETDHVASFAPRR